MLQGTGVLAKLVRRQVGSEHRWTKPCVEISGRD